MNTDRKNVGFARTRRLVGAAILFGTILSAQVSAQSSGASVYLDSLRQVIRGFGGANIVGWNPGLSYGDMTPAEIQTAFGTGPGTLGLTIMRLRIPPDSTQFSINVASAKLAESLGAKVIATPWTPPAWMKTSDSIIGGSLDTNNYAAFAGHLKAFADTMAGNGAPLYAISVQNEPDFVPTGYEGCGWNAAQFLQFMRYNAPAVGIPVFMPEAATFNFALSDPTLNDSLAASHVAFIGGHVYGATPTSYSLALSKGKEVWMTEYLINSPGSGVDMDSSWKGAMATARSINDCMNADMSAYVWWYIVRYYGPIDDGTKGGVAGAITKKGYVMAQYARFVRPGYQRIKADATPQRNIYVSAYQHDSSFVIVALNTASSPIDQTFILQNGTSGSVTVTPYVTSKTKNCEQQSTIGVSGGMFTATLADSSVTTFVGTVVTGVQNDANTPQTFQMYQNFPNPFNPATEIRYDVAERSLVTVAVYDVLGRKIATLVNQVQNPGRYRVTFDAATFPSGVYFYRLQSEGQNIVRKMLLLK